MRSIDIMLSRPGIYVVVGRSVAFVEVDPGGACHQLELRSGTYQRDGILRPGRWVLDEVQFIEGPFARINQGA